jgi:phenylalanine-4-hydroxylase
MNDSIIAQDWNGYTAAEHAMWNRLFSRQVSMLGSRMAPAFMQGIDVLRMSKPGIPDFVELSSRLTAATGWSVVAVPGLIPDEEFFEHLANRRFVAGRFIRTPEQIDYLEEPDVFHDVFGHVPLLVDPVFANYMQAYGQGGLRAMRYGSIHRLARLYWYTVEFGLIRDGDGDGDGVSKGSRNGDGVSKGSGDGGGAADEGGIAVVAAGRGDGGGGGEDCGGGDRLRLYGAGIASSNSESLFALDSDSPNRLGFDLKRVMRTKYRIDSFQRNYFVIDNFEQLLKQTLETDFAPLYAELDSLPDIEVGTILPTDRVITRGADSHR